MTASEVEAFERRLGESSELSRLVDRVRAELVARAAQPSREEALETALLRACERFERASSNASQNDGTSTLKRELSNDDASAAPDARETSVPERSSECDQERELSDWNAQSLPTDERASHMNTPQRLTADAAARSGGKRRKRRLEFIPKLVATHERREDTTFVFKRATIMSPEERARRAAARRPQTSAARSIFTRVKASYSLVDSAPNYSETWRATTRLRPEYAASLDAKFRERAREDGTWTETPAQLLDRSALSISAKPSKVGVAIAQGAVEKGGLEFASGILTAEVAHNANNLVGAILGATFATELEPRGGLYEFAPVEYAQGQTRVAEIPVPYQFEELGSSAPTPSAALDEARVIAPPPVVPHPVEVADAPLVEATTTAPLPSAAPPVEEPAPAPPPSIAPPVVSAPKSRFAVASQETIDAITAAIGQSAHIMPQRADAYFSAELDAEDREALGTTLSAEDRRLAELLGREPTAIDLDEYYWEEVEDEDAQQGGATSRASFGLIRQLFYIATSPPVLVGRATISIFRTIFPHDIEREEASRETRRRNDDKEQVGRLSDMMISTIAGVLIAVCIVFPLLYRVVEELYITVATSTVRKYSQNVTMPPLESELDVMPFITEQILHPRFDASSVDGSGTTVEMESDGLPTSH